MSTFDKDMRDKLYHHTEAYDQASFQNILAGLPHKRERKRVIPYLYFTFMIVSALLFGLYLRSDSSKTQKQDQTTLIDKDVAQDLASNIGNLKTEQAQKAIDRSKTINQVPINNKENHVSLIQDNNKSKINIFHDEDGKNMFAERSQNQEFINLNKTEISASLSNTTSKYPEENIIKKDNETERSFINNLQREVIEVPKLILHSNDKVNVVNHCFQSSSEEPDLVTTNKSVVGKPSKFYEIMMTGNNNNTVLSSIGEEKGPYEHARENSEQHISSYGFAAYAGVRLRNNVVVKTGVSFTNLRDKFTYNDPDKKTTKTIRSVKYIYGSTNRLRDSIVTIENIDLPGGTLTSNNNYTYIDIPVIAEIPILSKSKFSFSVNPGVMVNARFIPKGYIFDEDGTSIISLQNDDVYKNRIGYSLYGGLSVKYKLNSRLELNIEPTWRYTPFNSTTETASISETMRTSQVGVSLRYHVF
jgi:hypothetical protein